LEAKREAMNPSAPRTPEKPEIAKKPSKARVALTPDQKKQEERDELKRLSVQARGAHRAALKKMERLHSEFTQAREEAKRLEELSNDAEEAFTASKA
jgi:hypothetical protein